ncbi:unnamed protein product [Cylindrotheca closterium]|uniref:Uncharacterized protein n=1 Tax=Cylindrotheca closterium TaxID=2856 RepID=A0AAD2G6V9_9STRA|nr:unnamed protein product [Cylindrotheca closterium]
MDMNDTADFKMSPYFHLEAGCEDDYMSKKSGGQFSNASSLANTHGTPYFAEDMNVHSNNNNQDAALLTGHFQKTDLKKPTDISLILGDQHSLGYSTLNSVHSNFHHHHHHQNQVAGSATMVPMDTGTTSPKDELKQRILDKVQRDYYVTWAVEDKYTSAYISPFTREIFLSGDLIDYQGSISQDNLVWYQSKEVAQDAAVARALDCFDLRERSRRSYGLRVKEAPYEMDCGPPLPALVPAQALRFGLVHNKPYNVNALSPGSSTDLSSKSSDNHHHNHQDTKRTIIAANSKMNKNPISTLAECYQNGDFFGQQHRGTTLTKANFVTWSDGLDHVPRFTGAFVCPIYGEIFLSGNWTHHEDDCHETNDGLVWYSSKKKAEGAAAAVAHDCYSLRYQLSTDTAIDEVRFCIEDPYEKSPRSETDIARLVPPEYWIDIQKLQESSRSGYTVVL